MPRKKYGFLLFDFPSDHEVDLALPTECEIIWALLINRRLGSRVKLIKATTKKRLETLPQYRYGVQFVHVGGHGSAKNLGLLGNSIPVRQAAQLITRSLHSLQIGKQRILCLSCCESRGAFCRMCPELRGYFTGCYYFNRDSVGFAESIVVWSMFYYSKRLRRPHQKIVERINRFFDEDILKFDSVT